MSGSWTSASSGFRNGQDNIFQWRNRIIALPSTLITRRFQGDAYQRLDRVTFKMHDVDALSAFSKSLSDMLKANHRQQEDFRLDDVASRVAKRRKENDAYNIIFWLSGCSRSWAAASSTSTFRWRRSRSASARSG